MLHLDQLHKDVYICLQSVRIPSSALKGGRRHQGVSPFIFMFPVPYDTWIPSGGDQAAYERDQRRKRQVVEDTSQAGNGCVVCARF